MPLEIERKFLLINDSWRTAVRDSVHLRQGYLSREITSSVRVRTGGSRAWLNIKSVTIGEQRQEFQYEIPLADAQVMLDDLCRRPLIEKVRYFIDIGAHTWEIDVFEGENTGLVVAEIELDSVDERFERPAWLGEEVTYDVRYYNTNLSIHPYQSW
jgi:adenylate cyclase